MGEFDKIFRQKPVRMIDPNEGLSFTPDKPKRSIFRPSQSKPLPLTLERLGQCVIDRTKDLPGTVFEDDPTKHLTIERQRGGGCVIDRTKDLPGTVFEDDPTKHLTIERQGECIFDSTDRLSTHKDDPSKHLTYDSTDRMPDYDESESPSVPLES